MTRLRPPNDAEFPEPAPPDEDGTMLSAEEAYARSLAEEKAFSDVYKSIQRALMVFCRSLVNQKSDAEEVFQNVWLDAFGQDVIAQCCGDIKHLGAMLRGIARNKAADLHREDRRFWDPFVEIGRSFLPWGREPVTPYEDVALRDTETFYDRAKSRLPPRCRQVWAMARDLEMPYAEIATELGIDDNTVAQHVRTGERLIHKYLVRVGAITEEGDGKELRS